RHTRFSRDWSADVCSSDLARVDARGVVAEAEAEQHLRLDAARPLLPLGAPFAGAVGEAIAADPLEGQQEIRPTEAVEGVGDPAEHAELALQVEIRGVGEGGRGEGLVAARLEGVEGAGDPAEAVGAIDEESVRVGEIPAAVHGELKRERLVSQKIREGDAA